MPVTLNPVRWYKYTHSTTTLVSSATPISQVLDSNTSVGWLFEAYTPEALASLVSALFTLGVSGTPATTAELTITNSVLTSWPSIDISKRQSNHTGYGFKFEFQDPTGINTVTIFRDQWDALGRGAIAGVQVRVTQDTGGGSNPVSGSFTLDMPHVYLPTTGRMTIGTGAEFHYGFSYPAGGMIELAGASRVRTILAPTSGRLTVGGASQYGSLTKTSGRLTVGSATQVASYWRTSGRITLGSATTSKNRFVVPLRLKAGQVTQDVGYMWVPVYLQLPKDDHIADWPWEFYYADGTKIPHLRRNRVDNQVHALVYMRPRVTVAQEFFCRVG